MRNPVAAARCAAFTMFLVKIERGAVLAASSRQRPTPRAIEDALARLDALPQITETHLSAQNLRYPFYSKA